MTLEQDQGSREGGVSRRALLGGAAALGIGAGLGYVADELTGTRGSTASAGDGAPAVAFYDRHQAGIATPAPEFLSFAAFDVAVDSAEELRLLLREWTAAAASLTRGAPYRPAAENADAAPSDPGEAVGLGPSRLTVTFGFGPALFGLDGADRFGFARRRPAALVDLPAFPGDGLEPARSGGDICVQACAEHPQVAFHAVHTLARTASGIATLRWWQEGFGRTSSTSRAQPTPRNLIGFKDGTNNIRAEDDEAMDQFVWAQAGDGPAWMSGGTYLVARRIKILFDVWDATSLAGQEATIGREKLSGAPLGGEDEFERVDLDARHGGQAIPADAHIRLSSPQANGGQQMLRRGYSFSEATEPGSGEIDAGLFFISFQRDPRNQFVPIQRRLAESDALSRHLLHTGSAVFACPPGVAPGGFVGEGLFV